MTIEEHVVSLKKVINQQIGQVGVDVQNLARALKDEVQSLGHLLREISSAAGVVTKAGEAERAVHELESRCREYQVHVERRLVVIEHCEAKEMRKL